MDKKVILEQTIYSNMMVYESAVNELANSIKEYINLFIDEHDKEFDLGCNEIIINPDNKDICDFARTIYKSTENEYRIASSYNDVCIADLSLENLLRLKETLDILEDFNE